MTLKPLYLEGGGAQVCLDGPALRVSRQETAERWFPLIRLERVVSARQVDWTLEALLACAEAGISVHFIGHDGTTIARCFGAGRAESEALAVLIDRLLEHPDWPDRYNDWLRAMEQVAVRSVLRRCGVVGWPLSTGKELRQWFFETARGKGLEAGYQYFGAVTRSALSSLVTQHWLDAGVDLDGARALGLNLIEDYTTLLFWDFELIRFRWLEASVAKNHTGEPPATHDIVRLFEQRRGRVDSLLRKLQGRFYRWSIELLRHG